MKTTPKRRLKGLTLYLNLLSNISMTFVVMMGHSSILVSTIFIICIALYSLSILYRAGSVKTFSDLQKSRKLSEKRLKMLRQIIDLSYTYSEYPVIFHEKTCSLFELDKLKKNEVLEFETMVRSYRKRKKVDLLSDKDRDFYSLLEAGFTPRELSIIYKLSNPNSIYVKKNRLKARMERVKKSPKKAS